MSLFDFFKRKKEPKKETKKGKKVSAVKTAKKIKEEQKPIIEPTLVPKKKIPGSAYGILVAPHITEKATDLAEKNKYIFKVYKRTNKAEIKRAIENIYGVNVVKVNIVNIKSKERRLGRQVGWKKGYKKAIVKIREGQKIEVLPR